jgi:hypothetical protein
MGRELYRVPLDFTWPINKVWRGFINPYYALQVKCPECHGSGQTPEAKRISDEWYGNAPFDPRAYGANPITREHPAIRRLAVRNVMRNPEYYLTVAEQAQHRDDLLAAGVDLVELGNGRQEDTGLVPLGAAQTAAVELEVWRLFCHFSSQWSHQLIQADVDALVADDRLWDFTRRPRNQAQADQLKAQEAAGGSPHWLQDGNGYHPTADEVNDWSIGGMGHDGINQWVCVKARCAREGIVVECPGCHGAGDLWVDIPYCDFSYATRGLLGPMEVLAFKDRAVNGMVPAHVIHEACDAWESSDPPEGPGFQLWETTSEGSPLGPVFSTLDELCIWAETNATTFADYHATRDEWRKMLDDDFVCHEETMENGTRAVFS